MKNESLKQFSVNTWDKMNLFLFISTLITTVAFLILFGACFLMKIGSDCHGMVLGMCGVFASLASAFFIAWIVRFYDLRKKKEQELKALELFTPYLTTVFCTINNFFPHIKCFAKINSNDTIEYPKEIIYYTDSSVIEENRSFVELNTLFRTSYAKLNDDLDKCFNSRILYQCNEAVTELLTGLKLNGLTYNLLEVFKVSSNPFFADTAFMDLYKNYNEFATYYETLSKLVSIKPKGELIELDATAKANYIKEIENIKSQIPVEHKGEIYKGRIRIQ